MFTSLLVALLMTLWVIIQGNFGTLAVAQYTLFPVSFILSEISILLITFKLEPDLRLQTQVLSNGQVVLIGMNAPGYERLRLYMNMEGESDENTVQQVNAGWRVIDDSEGDRADEFTSDGGITQSQMTPSNTSQISTAFVSEFNSKALLSTTAANGKCNATPTRQVFANQFSINDEGPLPIFGAAVAQ